MADRGACRRVSEVVYRDTTTTNAYSGHTYIGTNHFRDTFSGGTDATTLVGARVEEGPQDPDGLGRMKWSNTYFVDGTLVPPLHFSALSSNLGIRRQTAEASGAAAIDTGTARGVFFSQEWRWTEAPPLGGFIALGFNCRAPGAAVTDSRLDTSNSTGQHWTNGWSIWGGRDSTNAYAKLFKNGVQVGSSVTLALPATGDTYQAEAWARGAGTVADPSRVTIWLNGTLFWDITDADDPYAAQTYVHAGMAGTAGIASSLVWDNFFITDVPSAPGAIRDFSTIWAELPIDVASAGSTVTLKTRVGRCAGNTLGNWPEKAQLSLRDTQGTTVWTGAEFANPSAGGLYLETNVALTSDGLATGAARSGLFRPVLRMEDADSLNPWNYNSEGEGTAIPTGMTTDHVRGYAVARTTLDITVPATLQVYPDTFAVSATLGAVGYGTDRPTFELKQGTTARHAATPAAWSGATASTDDVADNAYDVASAGVGVDLIFSPAPTTLNTDIARVFSSVPVGYTATYSSGTTVVSSPEDRFTVDPRLTPTTQVLVNVATYSTPPSANSANMRRQVNDLGFVAVRLTNARGEGVNGLTVDQHIWDDLELVGDPVNPAKSRIGQVTGTHGGEAGWIADMLTWDNVLPAGVWDVQRDVTAPANAVGLESAVLHQATLLATDPNLQLVVGAGHPAAVNQTEHWHPGDDLLIGAALYDRSDSQLVAVDDGTSGTRAPTVVVGRFNTTYGVAQYYAADKTWKTLTGTAVADKWAMAASAGDPRVYVLQIAGADTTSWSNSTLFFICNMFFNDTPYSGTSNLDAPGPVSPHGRAYQVMTSGGPTSKPDHWSPGMAFQAGMTVVDMATGRTVPVDGFTRIALFRLQDSGLDQGRGEYLDANNVWQTIVDSTTQVYFHDAAMTRPDSNIYIKTWSAADTAAWGSHDIFVLAKAKVGFFEFNNFDKEPGVGANVNRHSGYAVDPLAAALGIASGR